MFEVALWINYIPLIATLPNALRANAKILAIENSIWAIRDIGHGLLYFGVALTAVRDQLTPSPEIMQAKKRGNIFGALFFICTAPIILILAIVQLKLAPLW